MEKQLIPQLRFPKYLDEWNKDELKKITSYVDYRGRAPKKSEKGHFLVTAKNIKKGFIDYEVSKEFVAIEDYSTVMSKGLPNLGDVLFTTEAPMGNVAQINNESIALAQRVIKFRGEITIQNSFLLYYMLSNVFQKTIKKKAIGTTVQGISGKELHKIIIKYPLIEEQQKIASFLTDVDNKITKLTKKKDLLEQYKKGVMQKIFNQELRFKDDNGNIFPDWEEKKITTFAKTSIGLVTSMTKHYVHKDIGVPLIRNSDIMGNKIRMEKLIYLDKVFSETHNNRRLKFNDVVTVHTGDIGVSSVINKDLDGCHGFATLNTRIKNIKEVLPSYLSWYFNSEKGIRYALSMATGDGRSNYNLKDFNKAIVPIPSIKEQTKIANFLSDLDVKIEAVNTQIEHSKTFKKGLLQQMFV